MPRQYPKRMASTHSHAPASASGVEPSRTPANYTTDKYLQHLQYMLSILAGPHAQRQTVQAAVNVSTASHTRDTSTHHKLVIQVLRHGYLVAEPLSPSRLEDQVTSQSLARSRLEGAEFDACVRRIACIIISTVFSLRIVEKRLTRHD